MRGIQEPYPAEIQAIRRVPYGLRGLRRFAKLLGLKIHPYEAFLLGLYFAGVTELVILIAKKNGKTTLLAVLALYHLLMIPRAEAVISAASKEQAALLHRQATLLIEAAGLARRALPGDRREPTKYEGVFEVREGMHVIRFEMGRLRVMPHEARTGDGVIPTLALVDELHRHPTGELYEVWRDGLLGNAQMITISTAGASMDSPLGELLTKARVFAMEQDGHRRTYTSPDGSFVLVEWALDPDEDTDDMRVVKSVNPAPWHTSATLRRRHDSPSMTAGQWLRMACGIWTEGEEPAILPREWDPLKVDIGQIEEGEEVILAPSVGHNAAVAIAALRSDGRLAVKVDVIEPEDGTSILVKTEDRILELCERYHVLEVHHPLGAFIRSADLLANQGVPMVEAPHSTTRLAAASGTFNRVLRGGLLMHDGDPTLRNHVLAATLKTNEAGERYEIADRSRALIAMVMAVHDAMGAWPRSPKIHAYKGA